MTDSVTPTALIITDYLKQEVTGLPDTGGKLEIVARRASEVDDALWRRTEALYTFNTIPDPAQAPRLKWIQLFSAGADHVLRHPISSLPISVTTVSGIHAVPIAEYTFSMLLAWLHRVPSLVEWQRQALWPPEPERMTRFVPRAELHGATLGVVGYGSIGRQIGRIGAGFGMDVVALRRSDERRDHGYALPGVGDLKGDVPSRFFRPADLHKMLAACDVTVLVVPLTNETRGWFDAAAIRAMKPGSIFINVARGGILDEIALAAALRDGHLAAAILDVFDQEPLPAESPLWGLSNLMMSPHIGGHGPLYEVRASLVFAENLARYLRGDDLLNVVDRVLQY